MTSPEGSARRPGSLAVEVTARCNRACVYCYNVWKADGQSQPPAELPATELVSLAESALAASGLRAVQITGGEPLLRPDLPEIIAGLRAPGRRISLVTDGGLLDEPMARELARVGVGPVQPTLLAADRALHDRLKGAESFDATVAAIARLRKAGVPVSVSFVCLAENHDRFREVAELCFALGVDVVALSRFCVAGEGSRDDAGHEALLPDREMLASCLAEAEEANARLGMKVQVAISVPLCAVDEARYPHLRFGRCAMSSRSPGFTIDPAGKLRACSISAAILGDLRAEPFEAIVDRATREGALREAARLPTECAACALAPRCGGGCRETARNYFGGWDHPDPLAPGGFQ